MINIPKSINDVQQMIANGIQESSTLDYKSSIQTIGSKRPKKAS